MSKMREALTMAYEAGTTNSHRRDKGINYPPKLDAIDAIAQRYGPLEFTREEVRGMLEEMWEQGYACRGTPRPLGFSVEISKGRDVDEILSRHTEAEGDKPDVTCGDCGRELEEVRPGKHQCTYCEIVRAAARDLEDRLTKRVAAIEKRVLADGHSENCTKVALVHADGHELECTCGHDQIQKPDPDSRV